MGTATDGVQKAVSSSSSVDIGSINGSIGDGTPVPDVLGVQSFHAVSLLEHENKESGLPLLPRSVTILGRFEALKTLRHRHLCRYLAVHRDKEECVSLVVQIHRDTLASHCVSGNNCGANLSMWFNQALSALSYLHARGIVHRNLCPENIYLQTVTPNNTPVLQLCHYGLFYISGQGYDVPFPIGRPRYLAPEVFLRPSLPDRDSPADPRVDTWMLGAVFLEVALGVSEWLPGVTQPRELAVYLLQLLKEGGHPMDSEPLSSLLSTASHLDQDFLKLIRQCLEPDPRRRPSAADLLAQLSVSDHVLDANYQQHDISEMTFAVTTPNELRSAVLRPLAPDAVADPLLTRTPDEIYHWWCLAGGKAVRTSERRVIPAIVTLPCLSGVEGSVKRGGERLRPRRPLFDDVTRVLDTKELHERIRRLPFDLFHPLLTKHEDELLPISKQPKVIKERDLEYQIRRCVLFSRLLTGYPHTRSQLWLSARVDVPPLRRAEVWAALLQVEGSAIELQRRYDAVDKESAGAADAQIAIDLPRCHQYEPRLASPAGHSALRRVLKAWVARHAGQYVYWQGVDSLLAPFLYVGLAHEALAFACLEKVVDKYLHGVFKADNMEVLEEYMRVYMQLLAFHEPQLAAHLHDLNLQPTQYALPWFFTLFSHKFPLEETVRLWDSLLLGNSSFPLCIAVAIWRQLRDEHDALSLDQTECWALVKDIPVLDTEILIKDAIRVFRTTPKSVTYRHLSSPLSEVVPAPPVCPLDVAMLSLAPNMSLSDLQELGSKCVVLDVRPREEWLRGAFSGSVLLPDYWTSEDESEDNLPHPSELDSRHRSLIKVVVASESLQAVRAANRLVAAGCRWVCVLHGGASTLRQAGLLSVPSAAAER